MEGAVEAYPVMVYAECEPEEAYANIQSSDAYTKEQKEFYSLPFLQAYKDGIDKFLLPQAETLETLVFKFHPSQLTNVADVCETMTHQEPEMVHYNNPWHMENSFRKTYSYSFRYLALLDRHMDLGGNQNNSTTGGFVDIPQPGVSWYTPYSNIIENNKAHKIIQWKYPREAIDGFGWEWDNVNTYRQGFDGHDNIKTHDKRFLAEAFDAGYNEGQNAGDPQKWGAPLWFAQLFQSDHRKMLGGADGNPFRGRKFFHQQSC